MRPDEVRAALADVTLVRRIYAFDELLSTSDWAKALIARANGSNDLHGTLVIANHQTAGRGRFERPWVAPAGTALLFSVILRVTVQDTSTHDATPDFRQLAVAAPVAVAVAIREVAGLAPRIKFPNDVLVNGKKVSGILLESASVNQRSFAVVGIGINVSQTAAQLPADTRIASSSLELESAQLVPNGQLLAAVLKSLEHLLDNPIAAMGQMNLLCETLGAHVQVQTAEGLLEGVASGVTADGALMLRTAVGVEQVVHSGDVMQLNQQRNAV